MLDLKDVYFFVQVVDRGGFTAAGESLRVPKSTLSHRVRELEDSLGVRLINRTSRQFGMTDVGTEFYQYALHMLQSADTAEEFVRQRLHEPSGTIRITTAVEIAQFALRDVIPTFLNRHPKVKIVEIATDRLVDMVAEGFDLALRGHVASLQNSTLVQRGIASVPWYLFASPEYLHQAGDLSKPEDLALHSTLANDRHGAEAWRLKGPVGQEVEIRIEPRFLSNNLIALKEAACANLGVAALPGYMCRAEIEAGKLYQILPGWMAADARMSALMPYRNGLLPAVRSFVDFLAVEVPRVTAFTPRSGDA
ncbi:LysR substrate-binding domain-containing protein [Rhizobium leguminosarum]|uniref:LysR substrate-binding domain-containing protein n=1 Tax=Rhizobium leguminosarum TaxID=384 RepID=UPI000489763D|nr:LysR substrate-binding domain-containing protein [Rhizobium leguminosarum]MBB4344495.1 DNA-binding transcriptional LysR family regulator [Rhizobium leguminosarum]MBB6297567.1 DNA-binding transcriptional LysR family regulator [Rhizobium leguminosarum]TCA52906.1 LysR family transcriptional regulator [Rhizobium leguminosarum bv. viciae]TCA68259.1 LysR family transcriptional regulator [Rhizobium leguminosarum bv. viciae]WFT86798.1 LysR substrate-binding domain-containing protein [Rhizobium legu